MLRVCNALGERNRLVQVVHPAVLVERGYGCSHAWDQQRALTSPKRTAPRFVTLYGVKCHKATHTHVIGVLMSGKESTRG
eukprot:COSAG05_NODE_7400_length_816_cov_2.479781_1_plen_79_part_10